MSTTIEDMTKKMDDFERTMEDVSVKMQDFNIYDLFKGSGGDGGNSDVSVLLVQNLEKKVFKKFEFIDEKSKKIDEENYKHKAEIGNIKNNLDNLNKQFTNYVRDNDITFNDFNVVIDDYKDKFDEIENKMESIYNKVMEELENKEKQITDVPSNKFEVEITNQDKNMEEKSRMSGNNFSDIEMKMVRDCAKKVSELEKHFKILVANINIESIKTDIGKLNDSVSQKANSNDLFDVKDNMGNFKFILEF